MQNRPDWCPHINCQFLMNSQDKICTGRLHQPEDHDGHLNTHRLCLDTSETGHGIFDLQINRTDAWNINRHLNNIMNSEQNSERSVARNDAQGDTADYKKQISELKSELEEVRKENERLKSHVKSYNP